MWSDSTCTDHRAYGACPHPRAALGLRSRHTGSRLQSGFTIIEVAITLVVVGLMFGSVLKAQEMITQAQIKNVIADLSGLAAAHSGYQYRYRALPGDDRNAGVRWAGPPAASSGDGNGIVSGTYNNGGATCANSVEACAWWSHLRHAGFVSGSGPAQPLNAFAGILGVQTGDGAGGPVMGGVFGLVLCSTNLPDKVAAAVDLQMDDGSPASGSVRATLQLGANPPLDNSVRGAYVEGGINLYLLCRAFA